MIKDSSKPRTFCHGCERVLSQHMRKFHKTMVINRDQREGLYAEIIYCQKYKKNDSE